MYVCSETFACSSSEPRSCLLWHLGLAPFLLIDKSSSNSSTEWERWLKHPGWKSLDSPSPPASYYFPCCCRQAWLAVWIGWGPGCPRHCPGSLWPEILYIIKASLIRIGGKKISITSSWLWQKETVGWCLDGLLLVTYVHQFLWFFPSLKPAWYS